jgi:hypothetical protein
METNRVYRPETAAAIAAAFDRTSRPSKSSTDDEELRRKVAQAIVRQADAGAQDCQRLSELVLGEFLGRDST